MLFARPPVLDAARVRENWFSGLTKDGPPLSGAGLGVNAFICIYLRQFLRARELPTAGGEQDVLGQVFEPHPAETDPFCCQTTSLSNSGGRTGP